jgi:SAM-dependent methyltransferase
LALPSELQLDKTERLRAHQAQDTVEVAKADTAVAPEAPAPAETADSIQTPSRPSPQGEGSLEVGARVVRFGKRVARGVLGERLSGKLRANLLEPRGMAVEALDRVDAVEERVRVVEARFPRVEDLVVTMHATTVNQELLKGEVRSVVEALEELGMAIAPAAGLAGASARLSELRERVNGLDRRLRSLNSVPAENDGRSGAGAAGAASEQKAPGTPAATSLFDYVGFERRFRGDPEVISEQLSKRYLDRLAANPPVLDIGCGNAGLVEQLSARGVEAIGIDSDPSMVAEARARGLDVRLVDGTSFLRGREPGSLGAIIATHLVEHLELAELVGLLELAASRLRPGGLFITETPNPASLIVLGNSYILDPTHVRPLHPSLLTFLFEGAGFRDVRLDFYSPARDYHLPLIDDPAAPPWTKQVNEAFSKLNHVLFGPQDYTLIATTAPSHEEEPD